MRLGPEQARTQPEVVNAPSYAKEAAYEDVLAMEFPERFSRVPFRATITITGDMHRAELGQTLVDIIHAAYDTGHSRGLGLTIERDKTRIEYP